MKNLFLAALVTSTCLSLIACGGSGSKSTPAQPDNSQAGDGKTEPTKTPEPTEDKQIQRSTAVSQVMDRKIVLVYNEKIEGFETGSRLLFQNGEILKTGEEARSGISCSLSLRNGKILTPGDSVEVKFKSGNGFGNGGNGYLDYLSVTQFEVSGSNKISEFVCYYRGNDPLLEIKLSDLDQTFGNWFKVIIYNKSANL